jgi:hypothetical protein
MPDGLVVTAPGTTVGDPTIESGPIPVGLDVCEATTVGDPTDESGPMPVGDTVCAPPPELAPSNAKMIEPHFPSPTCVTTGAREVSVAFGIRYSEIPFTLVPIRPVHPEVAADEFPSGAKEQKMIVLVTVVVIDGPVMVVPDVLEPKLAADPFWVRVVGIDDNS